MEGDTVTAIIFKYAENPTPLSPNYLEQTIRTLKWTSTEYTLDKDASLLARLAASIPSVGIRATAGKRLTPRELEFRMHRLIKTETTQQLMNEIKHLEDGINSRNPMPEDLIAVLTMRLATFLGLRESGWSEEVEAWFTRGLLAHSTNDTVRGNVLVYDHAVLCFARILQTMTQDCPTNRKRQSDGKTTTTNDGNLDNGEKTTKTKRGEGKGQGKGKGKGQKVAINGNGQDVPNPTKRKVAQGESSRGEEGLIVASGRRRREVRKKSRQSLNEATLIGIDEGEEPLEDTLVGSDEDDVSEVVEDEGGRSLDDRDDGDAESEEGLFLSD